MGGGGGGVNVEEASIQRRTAPDVLSMMLIRGKNTWELCLESSTSDTSSQFGWNEVFTVEGAGR